MILVTPDSDLRKAARALRAMNLTPETVRALKALASTYIDETWTSGSDKERLVAKRNLKVVEEGWGMGMMRYEVATTFFDETAEQDLKAVFRISIEQED